MHILEPSYQLDSNQWISKIDPGNLRRIQRASAQSLLFVGSDWTAEAHDVPTRLGRVAQHLLKLGAGRRKMLREVLVKNLFASEQHEDRAKSQDVIDTVVLKRPGQDI